MFGRSLRNETILEQSDLDVMLSNKDWWLAKIFSDVHCAC